MGRVCSLNWLYVDALIARSALMFIYNLRNGLAIALTTSILVVEKW